MKNYFSALAALLLCPLVLTAQNQNERKENRLRIVSYNTHNCIGTDKKTDYDRIADIIAGFAPDVVALQELDSMTVRHRNDVLGELALRTQMHATYAPAIKIGRGRYGIGILSKEKPLNVSRIPLPGKEEKRMLLMAEFEHYVVLCTHLSLTARSRISSVDIILDAVKEFEKPVFLAGDMNDTHDSAMQQRLTQRFITLNDPGQATFGAEPEARCIDFIYGLDNGAVFSVATNGVFPEEVASDHRPVWVDVRLHSNDTLPPLPTQYN